MQVLNKFRRDCFLDLNASLTEGNIAFQILKYEGKLKSVNYTVSRVVKLNDMFIPKSEQVVTRERIYQKHKIQNCVMIDENNTICH